MKMWTRGSSLPAYAGRVHGPDRYVPQSLTTPHDFALRLTSVEQQGGLLECAFNIWMAPSALGILITV